MSRTINPKRVRLVREFRMLDAEQFPDNLSREKLYEMALVSGFPVGFFLLEDPPELGPFICSREG